MRILINENGVNKWGGVWACPLLVFGDDGEGCDLIHHPQREPSQDVGIQQLPQPKYEIWELRAHLLVDGHLSHEGSDLPKLLFGGQNDPCQDCQGND